MTTDPKVFYEFGPFRVDPEKQVLLRDGVLIPLAPKAFEMLVVLLRRSREVVTKDELLTAIWPDSFVEEANLSQNIFLLRKALGDTGDERRYIVTLPGRGYQLAAQVRTLTQNGDAFLAQVRSHTELVIEEQVSENSVSIPKALPEPRPRWRGWILPATIGGTILLASVISLLVMSHKKPVPLSDRDVILVADFANRTGDAVFDDALRQGLEVELQQSPHVSLLSEDDIQKSLRLMRQPADRRLMGPVAREVCVRTGAAIMLEGSIQAVGTQYVLGLRATDCRNGANLGQEQIQVARKEDVLAAIGNLTSHFRQRTGESASTLQTHDLPLAEATTGSLEALQAYSIGLKVMANQGDESAIPFFKRAIEFDPNFAMAYAYLALSYGSSGDSGLASQNATKAYQLREHASDNERFFIAAYYFGRATGNQEKARQVCEEWSRTYPRDPLPHAFLSGFVDLVLANYDDAIEEGKTALALAPDRAFAYMNLGENALYIDRYDVSRQAIHSAEQRGLNDPALLLLRYDLASTQNDDQGMQQAVEAARGKPDSMDLLADRQAYSLAYAGQLRRARVLSRQAIDIAQHQGDGERAAQFAVRVAIREAFFGNTRDARADAATALGLANNRETNYGAAVAFALAGDIGKAEKLASDLEKNYPDDTSVHFDYLPAIRAIMALNRNDPEKAISILETSIPYELGTPRSASTGYFGSLYPILIRGEALLASRKGPEAVREFQKILDHRGIMIGDPVSSLAQYGLARSLVLAGDKAKARAVFEQAMTTWKDADPDLPIVNKAKDEYALIQSK
jgi:DNA-binding winged helix-turn-helix (wHTH) protein/lipoprotein NlpI